MTFLQVICENAPLTVNPFPESHNSVFGPGAHLKEYGLTPSREEALARLQNGQFQTVLRKSRPVKFLVEMKHNSLSVLELEDTLTIDDQDSQVTIKCNLVEHGEYGLAVFAKEPGKGEKLYSHICTYLLSFTTQDLQSVYGHVYDQILSNEIVCYNYSPDVYSALVGADFTAEYHGKLILFLF